jgi:ABC-type transporter Mla MlaB component
MSERSGARAADAAVDTAEHRVRAGDRFVRCDLGSVVSADLDLVDRLARLRLDARRRRCRLEIRTANAELVELLELAGLDGVVLLER